MTGIFTRNGERAGWVNGNGYRYIEIDGVDYRENRLAWLSVTGDWPFCQIDHRDTDRSNNSFANLRLATCSQNKANSRRYRNNRSGYKGVYWHKRNERWCAQVTIDRRQRFLGHYETAEEAHAAYLRAAGEGFGEYSRAA